MPDPTLEDIFVGRQPILDRSEQVVAYELLFRSGQTNFAQIEDDMSATASVVSHVFSTLGAESTLGANQGFINVDQHLLMSDPLEALPRDRIVLEILETVPVTPELIERCIRLREMGFTLALDDFIGEEEKYRPLMPHVDIVKVDVKGMEEARLRQITRTLKNWPLKLLAEKVDSREQAALLQELGYDLFQGYYFAKPTVISGKKLSASELSLMRLFGLLLDDADTGDLEKILKTEPGLSINLLRLTNSAACGLRVHITSLRQAITILGRRQLQRWLQLLLYTSHTGVGASNPLLLLAATRGRFMELAAGRTSRTANLAEQAFMTGIMSLMPTLLGLPMEEVLKELPVTTGVAKALMSGEGDLGKLLGITEMLEGNSGLQTSLQELLLPGLDAATVNQCQADALAWAANIGRPAA